MTTSPQNKTMPFIHDTGKDYDFIIIGAGCVGLSFALALDEHFKIALIDIKSEPNQPSEAYDARVFAINRASEYFFNDIGVWKHILSSRHAPYEKMNVWDENGGAEIEFDCRDNAESHLGHIIELQIIENALRTEIKQKQHIDIFLNTPLQHIQRYHDHVLLLAQGKRFQGKCLIAADGANSWVREHAGFEIMQMPYEHTAVVATVETEQSHEKTARQVFLHTGPLAFLPLDREHYSSIVWSTSHVQANALMALNHDDFCKALTQAFSAKLGRVLHSENRHSFPLVARHAKQYTQRNIALMGDAAHTIHPLAGQGMNLGLADAKVLSDRLNQCNLDYPAALIEYERLRKGKNALMLDTMTGFVHLFGHSNPIVSNMRNQGIKLVNQSTLIKQLMMQHAAGLT